MKSIDLEGTLWRLEYREEYIGERKQFYKLVNQMWLSEQISETRIEELIHKFPKFGEYFKLI